MKGYYVNFTNNHKKNNSISSIASSETSLEYYRLLNDSILFLKNETEIVINTNQTSKKTFNKPYVIPIKTSKSTNAASDTKKDSYTTTQIKKTNGNKKNGWYFLAAIASLLSLGYYGATRKKARHANKFRSWAFKNKFKSLSFVVFSKVAIAIASFWIGVKFFELDYTLPSFILPALGGTYFMIWATTLFKKKNRENMFSLLKNKLSHLFISVIGMLLCITLGNKVANENSNHINTTNHINKRCSNYFESKSYNSNHANFVSNDAVSKMDDGSNGGLKAGLTILAILSVVVLQLATIIGGCLLACSGSEGYAVLLIIGGTIFLVALAILTIYWITRIGEEKDSITPQTY